MVLFHRRRLQFLALLFFGFWITFPLQAQDLDVPYVPTPNKVIEKMLDLSDVDSSDYVIDLGSGDGRIVIAAAKRGATGHGIDLDPERIAEARQNAAGQEVTDQILFREGNIFDTDFSAASVVTMYLLPSINKKLSSRLREELRPGTQIVSHSFDMGDWQPDKRAEVTPSNSSRSHGIYYWVVPAKVEGDWNWSTDKRTFSMSVEQQFQRITATLTDEDDRSYKITKQKLKGDRITIGATRGNEQYIFSGQVTDNSIQGIVQHHSSDTKTMMPWSAQRR